jgi:hypothetical protein
MLVLPLLCEVMMNPTQGTADHEVKSKDRYALLSASATARQKLPSR